MDVPESVAQQAKLAAGKFQHEKDWKTAVLKIANTIDGSDYTLIDNSFDTQGAALSAEVATATAEIAATSAAAVSEPANLLLAVSGVTLLRPRRSAETSPPEAPNGIASRCRNTATRLGRLGPGGGRA